MVLVSPVTVGGVWSGAVGGYSTAGVPSGVQGPGRESGLSFPAEAKDVL